jgi:hypothetical protein
LSADRAWLAYASDELTRDPVPQSPISHVVLVQNWLEELKRLVPRK